MTFFKDNAFRSRKYLDWVKSQPCIWCDAPADDPHHIIGVGEGGMGTKACDLLTMPMCRRHHDEMHRGTMNQEAQWKHVAKTLQKAIKEGFNF